MSANIKEIVQKIIEDASAELRFANQEVIDVLLDNLEDGTLIGQKTGRVKKISDSILASLRKEGAAEDED